MSRLSVFLCVMLAVLSSFGGGAFACGDKLLVLGRGVRFAQIHRAARAAAILIYMNPSSQLAAAGRCTATNVTPLASAATTAAPAIQRREPRRSVCAAR